MEEFDQEACQIYYCSKIHYMDISRQCIELAIEIPGGSTTIPVHNLVVLEKDARSRY